MKDGLGRVVGEADAIEEDGAANAVEREGAAGSFVLGLFVEDFAGAFEAGESLGDERADAGDLHDGSDEHGEKGDVGEESAERHAAGENLASAEIHDGGGDDAHESGGSEAHERSGGESLENVVEEALDAGLKDFFLAFLGVIALDDANAGERFGEAAGNLGVDFGAGAVDGANGLEGATDGDAEGGESADGHGGHGNVDAEKDGESEEGSENAAGKFDEAGADEIADAFDVGHDARDESAGFVGVVIGDGKAADVSLDLGAELGDHALRGFREKLREGVGAESLDEGGGENGKNDGNEEMDLALGEDVVDEEFRRGGEDEAGEAVDDHEDEAEGENSAAGLDEREDVGKELPVEFLGFPGRGGIVEPSAGAFAEVAWHGVRGRREAGSAALVRNHYSRVGRGVRWWREKRGKNENSRIDLK